MKHFTFYGTVFLIYLGHLLWEVGELLLLLSSCCL